MQVLWLTKDGGLKLKRKDKALYKKDFEDLPRSLPPGEWCVFFNSKTKESYAGFVNLHAKDNWPLAFMVQALGADVEAFEVWNLVERLIAKAVHYREVLSLETNARLVFGERDHLPGLVVDQFENATLIQINTAGMDRYRSEIKTWFEKKYPHKKVYFLDQKSYREAESLPQYPNEAFEATLKIVENGLKLQVESNVLQKVGYYFDHRLNRASAKELIQKLRINKHTGLDLFSYVGSWGLHLLAAGVEQVDFVDQGNFENSVLTNATLNQFENRARFTRDDCFHYLDVCEEQKKTYDIICSDPPAFTKNAAGKNKALEGYIKLHTKVLKSLNPGGLALIGSCTHYVSLEELDQTMQEAALRTGRSVRLIDIGLQGWDHPIRGLEDKGNYIKYLAYLT